MSDAGEALRRGDPTPSRLDAAARTCALAQAAVADEIPRRGRAAIREVPASEAQARTLLLEAVDRTQADRRERSWWEFVERAVALDTIRRGLRRSPSPSC